METRVVIGIQCCIDWIYFPLTHPHNDRSYLESILGPVRVAIILIKKCSVDVITVKLKFVFL